MRNNTAPDPDRDAALQLLTLLQEEKSALEQNNLNSLETVIVSKAAAVERLQKLMTTNSVAGNPDAAPEQGIQASELNPILRQCLELNEHNHRIASARHKAVSTLLSTIRGEDIDAGPVYGKDGHMRTASSSTLGSF